MLLFSDVWMSLFCEGFYLVKCLPLRILVNFWRFASDGVHLSCFNEMRVSFCFPDVSVVRFY